MYLKCFRTQLKTVNLQGFWPKTMYLKCSNQKPCISNKVVLLEAVYLESLLYQNLIIPFSAPCIHENIGNKQCEAAQNHAACEYDGGDCCLHWGRYASFNTKKYKYNTHYLQLKY